MATIKEIRFSEKEQDWQNETTRYWFSVTLEDEEPENYCVADCNGQLQLLDSEGYPIEPCNDHSRILDALAPHYEEHIHA